ncbi:MAG: hypothetical protein H8D86_00630, partial [Planctomycetes bacterium]|nr:hypothetical protein [Planctomycetota bacterium]
ETTQRIFGAGVKLKQLLNIERIQVLTGGGDDIVYVYGSDMGAIGDLLVNTGSGSDRVIIGGDQIDFKLSYPKNNDLFYTTVDGFQVNKNTNGQYIASGTIDGMKFYKVRSLNRITPFVVENPAQTVFRTIRPVFDASTYKSPVVIDTGSGFGDLNDTIEFNLTSDNGPLVFASNNITKYDVEFDSAKIHLAPQSGTSSTDLAIKLLTAGDADATKLVKDTIENYLRFKDMYYDQTLLHRIHGQTLNHAVDIPPKLPYYVIQDKIEQNTDSSGHEFPGTTVVKARPQFIEFAARHGLTTDWHSVNHPDPSRAATGEQLHKLTGIYLNGVAQPFQAQHTETVVFDGDSKTILYDFIGLTLTTNTRFDATFSNNAITVYQVARVDTYSTLGEDQELPSSKYNQLFFRNYEELQLTLTKQPSAPATSINHPDLDIRDTGFEGILNITGSPFEDVVTIKKSAAQIYADLAGGDDTIVIGNPISTGSDPNRSLDYITADIFLMDSVGHDQVILDNSAHTVSEDLSIDANIFRDSTESERLSRITSALSLTGITADENSKIADKLTDAAVPFGQKALQVNHTDVTSFVDDAAQTLLARLSDSVDDAQTAFNTARENTVNLLKDRDLELIKNQIELYVRTRFYEGSSGKDILNDVLDEISRKGVKTYLRYIDYDSYFVWDWFNSHYETRIDWGDSNRIPRKWSIREGVNTAADFYRNPNNTFSRFGLGGVSSTSYAKQYSSAFQNIFEGKSLYELIRQTRYTTSYIHGEGSKRQTKLLAGGKVDGDEYISIFMDARPLSSQNLNNVYYLARFYDEVKSNYLGMKSTYESLLKNRGLNTNQLNALYNTHSGNQTLTGYDKSNKSWQGQLITDVADISLDIDNSYLSLSSTTAAKVNHLNSSSSSGFSGYYTTKLNSLKNAIATATDDGRLTYAELNSVINQTQVLKDQLDPNTLSSVDQTSGIQSEAQFTLSEPYGLFKSALDDGLHDLLVSLRDILNGNPTPASYNSVNTTAASNSYATLKSVATGSTFSNIKTKYKLSSQAYTTYSSYHALNIKSPAIPQAILESVLRIKKLDKSADRFEAFIDALDGNLATSYDDQCDTTGATGAGSFEFDSFKTSFLGTQRCIEQFYQSNGLYIDNLRVEAQNDAQAESLEHDQRDIAAPVINNQSQRDLF